MADIFLQCVQKNIPPGLTIEFELVSFCKLFVRLPPNFRAGRPVEAERQACVSQQRVILPVDD